MRGMNRIVTTNSGRNAPCGRNAPLARTKPPSTNTQPPVRWVFRHTVSLDSVHGVRIPMNQFGSTRVRKLPRKMKSSPTPSGNDHPMRHEQEHDDRVGDEPITAQELRIVLVP